MFHNSLRTKVISFLFLFLTIPLTGQESTSSKRNFTINYSNISILEYMKFVSKITGKNFIYNQSDLNFTISIVSEEPVTAESVMDTLIQVLRLNGLTLIEDGNNLVIKSGSSTGYVSKVVPPDGALNRDTPIITKLFRIKNANIDSVAAIIRQMISSQALLQVSQETRQIIISDMTSNIKRISDLIDELDSTQSPVEIETYKAKFGRAEDLIGLLKQIMSPLSQGNTYVLVPQELTNTIYMVSTPQLVEKSLSILGKLDVHSAGAIKREFKPENLFIYQPKFIDHSKLEEVLENVRATLEGQGYEEKGIVETLGSAEWIKETNSFIFSGDESTINKLKEILSTIDVPSKEQEAKSSSALFTYKPKNKTASAVYTGLQEIISGLEKSKEFGNDNLLSALKSARVIESTNSIIFTGNQKVFTQLQDLLSAIDLTKGASGGETFYIYKIQKASPKALQLALKEIAQFLDSSKIEDQEVMKAIEGLKYLEDSNSIIFSAPATSIDRIKELVTSFDTENLGSLPGRQTYTVYQIKNTTYTSIAKSIDEMAKYLSESKGEDSTLIETLKTYKYIPQTNSLVFSGSKENLDKIKPLVTSLDIVSPQGLASRHLVYNPKHVPGESIKEQVLSTAKRLKESNLSDPEFINSLEKVQWDSSSLSLIFTGNQEAINEVQALLSRIDTPSNPDAIEQQQTYFTFHITYVSKDSTIEYLNEFVKRLKEIPNPSSSEKQLIKTIESKQWIDDSNSFMFYGSQSSIDQIKDMLTKYDVSSAENKPAYFLYKLKNTSGHVIEENLDDFIKNLKTNSAVAKKYADLIELIDKIRWIEETNSLVLTGTGVAIDEAKELIASFDVQQTTAGKTDQFFMYQPRFLTPEKLEELLKQTASNLKSAGLSDSYLLRTIDSMKINKQTNSTVFTGSTQTLDRLKGIIADLDNEALASLGETDSTFLLYKLQVAAGSQVIKALDGVSKDLSSLSKQNDADKEFLNSLKSVKFIEETNSLLFTGTPGALSRVRTVVQSFDVSQLAGPTSSEKDTYLVYKPKYVAGPELISTLVNFAKQLQTNKVSDPDLYKTLEHIQWDEKTKSLVFTGTPTSLARTQELLQTFDVQMGTTGDATASIQGLDETSFLVYKLQYHKGEEIQQALRAVARDLTRMGANADKNLLDSISAIQLIPMTNSLLVSGGPNTLKRLKELIRNLDIPLKQVFIEMLIIETSFTNGLSFGLNWAGKALYKNRVVGAVNNLQSPVPQQFVNQNAMNATTVPTGDDISFNSGFDLGVIGDIILHKGRTFITLGSLVSALQSDQDSTIISTPKLITQDSKTSEIFIGSNVPFAGSFVSQDGANTVQTQNLEYRDIGISLVLTPVLGNSDIITLNLELSRTQDIGQGTTVPTSGIQGITTSKTTMNTQVHIPNKNFLVLSGMVDSTKRHDKTGIPCLGCLPLIGAAFSENNTFENTRNIVIFVRPHIITSYKDMIQVTSSQEDFFRDYAGSIQLENDFNEAMEMIKTPDDE